MASFRHEGKRLAYMTYGSGPRVVILLPGLLLPSRMHEPLAKALAERGNRVVLLDLLGHGRSDRPRDMWRYSMRQFAEEVVALMDHLEIDEAVVGGTSLGANVTLEVAAAAPERLRGMVVEMPVLDNALLACAVFFTPLMLGLTFGEPIYKRFAALLKRIPQEPLPFYAGVGLDWIGQAVAKSRSQQGMHVTVVDGRGVAVRAIRVQTAGRINGGDARRTPPGQRRPRAIRR